MTFKPNTPENTRTRPAVIGAAILGLALLAGCTNGNQQATIPASGVTSSNGGGMRATGAIPDAYVSGGNATVTTEPANPRVPRY